MSLIEVRNASLLAACVVIAVLGIAGHAKAAACETLSNNQIQNCGFESGNLSNWNVLPGGTSALLGCGGAPFIAPVSPGSPGSGSYRLEVNGDSGGDIHLSNVGCATVDQFVTIDPSKTYLVSFQGTVMNLIVADMVDIVLKSFNDGFNAGLGYSYSEILEPGWCHAGTIQCPALAEMAIATAGTNQDHGYLDTVIFREVPEPGTLMLISLGLVGLTMLRVRNAQQRNSRTADFKV